MRDILADGNRPLLARLAASQALLAFDFDGTLAPIVRDPARADMRPTTRELFEAVANAYPCVVISGRSRSDVERRVHGTGVFDVMGNHGIETDDQPPLPTPSVSPWVAALKRDLFRVPGVVIEDKARSVAVHYRRSTDRRRTRAAILRSVSSLAGARVVLGKCVVNLVAHDAPHKGTALSRARERFACDLALYVGDDRTDEDVFGLDHRDWLLAVRVGHWLGSKADFYVPDQKSVDVLLARLLQLRQETWIAEARAVAGTPHGARRHP